MAKKKREKKNLVSKETVPAVVDLPPVNVRYLSEMPPWMFWGLFFLFTGYFLVVKIASNDLWWHMACGRFMLKNGIYPPTGTFTFSPVNPTTPNAATWLGDIVLYVIYAFLGKDIGLQIFRIVAILIPVGVFLKIGGNKYNTWTMIGGVALVLGTLQQHLLRNSIFAMIFLPLMVLAWHSASNGKNYKLLLVFPLILLPWTYMHGYALVGLVILLLFLIGESIDQIFRN